MGVERLAVVLWCLVFEEERVKIRNDGKNMLPFRQCKTSTYIHLSVHTYTHLQHTTTYLKKCSVGPSSGKEPTMLASSVAVGGVRAPARTSFTLWSCVLFCLFRWCIRGIMGKERKETGIHPVRVMQAIKIRINPSA